MDRRRDADGERPSRENDGASEKSSRPLPAATARSGDFSADPAFDPDQLFEVIGSEDNDQRVTAAMRAFLTHGEMARFEQAVAVFVRSARARGEPVEQVLAVLIELAEAREGVAYPHDWTLTDLRWAVLRGVLIAFYGDTSLAAREPEAERRIGRDRRHDDIRASGGERGEAF